MSPVFKEIIPMRRRLRPAAALAVFLLAMPAAADIIYSNLLDTAIPTTFDGVSISVGSGTLNPFFGGVAVANNAALQPIRTGTGGLGTLSNLAAGSTLDGATINGTTTFIASGDGGSQNHLGTTFTAGQESYIGFKLDGTNYGWMRVVFTDNTGGAMVKDWAYDNSGSAISVGGIIQSGQNLTLATASTIGSVLANSNAGATNLLKNSAGISTLSTINTYTGTTTVSSGNLSVSSSGSINTSSGVTIDGGTFRYNASTNLSPTVTFTSGTLGGTNWNGTLGGLSIGTGQTISPGNSTGTATTSSETWAGGGTYLFEINNATGTVGATGTSVETSGWDLLAGTGTLDITATSGSQFNISVTSLGLDQVAGDAVNFNDTLSYNWLIADFASVVNFAADAFSINTSSFLNDFTGAFAIARGDTILGGDDTQIYLTYTSLAPVPEPRSILLVTLGAFALLRRRRS